MTLLDPEPDADAPLHTASAGLSLAGHELLRREDPEIYALVEQEYVRQRDTLYLVAASSVASPAVLACGGMVTTNVTTEGYPGARYHAGCRHVDDVERLAIERAKQVFGAQYANVQPHSGTSANLAVLFRMLEPGATILGMELDAGGHLSHGAAVSVVGRSFNVVRYGVNDAGWIDLDEVRALARLHRPKMIICGASAYPRHIDYAAFRAVADEVGAYLLADISHVAGLIAGGCHPSPVDVAHFTTTSTYKQLCGPRGGLILIGGARLMRDASGKTLAELMGNAVFPFMQGTPDLSAIVAKAVALRHAATPAFRALAERITRNAGALAQALATRGYRIATGGTDTHMVLIDLRPMGIAGRSAERALESCNIVVNKNMVPNDTTSASVAGGVRLGVNVLSSRGMGEAEMERCAELVDQVISSFRERGPELSDQTREGIRATVQAMCDAFPLPGYPASKAPDRGARR